MTILVELADYFVKVLTRPLARQPTRLKHFLHINRHN